MIRAETSLELCLVRHAEAQKNLANIHGGGNQQLTPRGVEQAIRIGNFLGHHGNVLAHAGVVVHQPEGRSAETAKIIGRVTAAKVRLEPELRGVNMGIIAGLPEDELERLYPEVAAGIRAWRASGGTSSHPKVPGSEPMIDFAGRVQSGLERTITDAAGHHLVAVVATTSTLTMLNHLVVNDGVLREEAYAFTNPPLGSVATWLVSDETPVQLMPATELARDM